MSNGARRRQAHNKGPEWRTDPEPERGRPRRTTPLRWRPLWHEHAKGTFAGQMGDNSFPVLAIPGFGMLDRPIQQAWSRRYTIDVMFNTSANTLLGVSLVALSQPFESPPGGGIFGAARTMAIRTVAGDQWFHLDDLFGPAQTLVLNINIQNNPAPILWAAAAYAIANPYVEPPTEDDLR